MPGRPLPLIAAALLAGLAASGAHANDPACAARRVVVTGVHVISMVPDAPMVHENMDVVIEGERIAAIVPAGTAPLPGDAEIVAGEGRWLLPGLIDMHVHFISEDIPDLGVTPEDILSPYLAPGVLQIVDLAATPDSNRIRDAVESGEIAAPFLATAAMVDGVPAIRDGAREIATPDDAAEVVADIAAAGFDFVKVYSNLDLDSFAAVLDAARTHDIRVIGHIPGGRETRPEDALLPGFANIAHAEEFSFRARERSDAEIEDIVQRLLENGTSLTSTLLLDHRILEQTIDPDAVARFEGLNTLHPVELILWFEMNPYTGEASPERIATLEAVIDFNARLVSAASDAGVTVLAGTDAAFVPGLAPGLSLHQELAAMVEAGMTPHQALAAATVVPAAWLGVAGDRGTVAEGMRANLVLLSADPLKDIANTRAIEAVILNGEVFPREALDARLAALDALYAPLRAYFSPLGAEAME